MSKQAEHKALTLILDIDGEQKRFVSPSKIKGSLWRQAATIGEEIESGIVELVDLDTYLQFICDVYNNQFDLATLEDGLDARDILKTIFAVTLLVMGQVSIASQMLTSNIDITELDEKKS